MIIFSYPYPLKMFIKLGVFGYQLCTWLCKTSV